MLHKYLFDDLLREGIGCFVLSLLNGTGLFILSDKVDVEKGWHTFASSSRRLSACFSGVVRPQEHDFLLCEWEHIYWTHLYVRMPSESRNSTRAPEELFQF